MSERKPQEKELDLSVLWRNYYKAALHFWWILLACVLLMGLMVPVAYHMIVKPEYTASCSFSVRVVNNSVTESLDSNFDIYYDKDLAEQLDKTFTYILTSDHLGDRVRDKLDRELEAGRIEATCIKGSNLFELKVKGDTPQLALQMLETVVELFPDSARYIVGDMYMDLLEEPTVEEEPTNLLSDWLLLAVGAFLGFAGGSGILLFMVWSLRTVHRPEELEELVNMPCLGLVPLARGNTDGTGEGEFWESIRGIARKLENTMAKNGAKVVLVTGTQPGEGKSLLSRHVAQTLASWGKRVYLLDGDLRRPSLYKALRCKDRALPMAAVLRGEAAVEALICDVGKQGLRLVGNSQAVDEPTVLLDSAPMQAMMDHLCARADYVVIDAPPCENLADVTVLQKYADGILYVVRQDYAPVERIVDTVESLENQACSLFGYVMNFAAHTAGGYGKYGYGAYGYGKYGNGYYGKYGHYSRYSKYYHTEQAEGPSEK